MAPMVRMKFEKSPCLRFCRIAVLRLSIESERVEFHKKKAWEHMVTARSNVLFAQCAKNKRLCRNDNVSLGTGLTSESGYKF